MNEPTFPVTCTVIAAPLQSSNAVLTTTNVGAEDSEALGETTSITNALGTCPSGQAVELSLGPDISYNSFLINPMTIPSGVSLIVDGGVTVFGTLDVAQYQVSNVGSSVCGVPGQHAGGCLSLLTFSGNDGLYGYGVIDGRGYGTLMCSSTGSTHNCSYAIGKNFWYLTLTYTSTTQSACAPIACYTQNTPYMVSDGGDNFTIYKITLRNTPQWHINIGANDVTIWGLKEQTTWSVANTDGMDLNGSDITVANSTLSGGDDAIAIGAYGPVGAYGWGSSNITIKNLTLYSRNGLSTSTALEYGISNVLIENSNLTGDVPSLIGTTVNGVTQAQMATVNGVSTGITSYTAALPPTLGDTRGINIKNSVYGTPGGSQGDTVSNYEFSNICLQDLDSPITFGVGVPGSNGIYNYPTLTNIQYNNIHVLAPTAQFVGYSYNGGQSIGLYTPNFSGYAASTTPPNDVHLNNFVFDDLPSGERSIGIYYAQDDNFTNTGNVYPPALNLFNAGGGSDTGYHDPAGNLYLDMNTDQTLQKSATSTPTPALNCPATNWPFIVGELYLSLQGPTSTSTNTNRQSATIPHGGSVTLNAVLEPATGQVEYWTGQGRLDTGAPALQLPVVFYEGSTQVGSAYVGANGTLASVTLTGLTTGTHSYSAIYNPTQLQPPTSYYGYYAFGSVTVNVSAASSATSVSIPLPVMNGSPVTISINVVGVSPTGTVTVYDGSTAISSALSLSGGAATLTHTFSLGSHSVTAVYSGDTNNAASTSDAVVFDAAMYLSSLSVTASLTTVSMNQPVTFTATVTGGGAGVAPTGSVTFTDGAANLGSATISGGVAVYTAPMINSGLRTITATYSGDSNYTNSVSTTAVTVVPPLVTGSCFVPL